jgi:hypothetical protein
MAKLEASEVADLLLEIGRRVSLQGGNPYSARPRKLKRVRR